MRGFSKGLLLGGIAGAAGLTYALGDKRTRRRMKKDSRRAMHKANSIINDITCLWD